MKNYRLLMFQTSVVVALALGVAGCSVFKKIVKTPAAPPTVAAVAPTEEPSVRNSLLHGVPELQLVHFDYDRAELREMERAVLTENAKWLKAHPDIKIQVAGHCDQRGTEAYNLALGQRRARSVRQYYTYHGISAAQIATISYGKEKPLCDDSDEACWQQNRRAETLVAFPEDISSTKPSASNESADLKDAPRNK